MSQITRCPSCATSFKVVADQLRISEGWVRCGQCKEVFDASAHLLPVAPPALLPDVSLTDVRPPPAPVARKADPAPGWGSRFRETRGGEAPSPSLPRSPDSHDEADGASLAAPAVTTPVLEIPNPAVPAFLVAEPGATGPGLLPPAAPFAWRPPSPSLPEPSEAKPLSSVREIEPATARSAETEEVFDVADVAFPDVPVSRASALVADPAKETLGDGHERSTSLADLRDSEGPADLVALGAEEPVESSETMARTEEAYPPLELPAPLPPITPPIDAETGNAPSEPAADLPLPVPDALPSVAFVEPPAADEAAALELVADDSPAAVLQARSRKSARSAADVGGAGDDDAQDESPEVSFVVAARRKAFWRKPAVRAVLVLVLLLLTLGLAGQVVVQERDRIAAMDARARPWLQRLCEPLRCEVSPRRQIADVVIDSSSFNKARGDSYQLAVAMKSKADIPLAMPAVELTLTDAQDQPVLRRVLLPTDMGAPAELSARGEWGTSVSVIVTTGGARVAGYRLLAFYP